MNFIIKFSFIFTSLILTSCSTTVYQSSTTVDQNDQILQEAVLNVFLPDKLPKNLAIEDPDHVWFFIQYANEGIQIMDQRIFESLKILELKPASLQGVTWRNGVKTREHVFKKSGYYRVYFADNIESEPEKTFSFEEVIYYQRP